VLNPIHLETLQAVVRAGSFADAARRLGYTGSAVSQQIAALERRIGTKLFERDAHGVRPTPAADFIVGRSPAALGTLRALEDEIALLVQGATGRLRLGSFPTFNERLTPAALARFSRAWPAVDLHLEEGEPAELIPMVRSRDLDIAVSYHYGRTPRRWPRDVLVEPLLREDLLLLSPPHLGIASPADTATLAELRDETWIATQTGTAGATTLLRLCADAGFEPSIAFRSNNYAVIHGLVAAGFGLAIVPALGCRPTSGVAATNLVGDGVVREIVMLRAPGTADATWTSMADALRASAAELCASTTGLSLPD
jgi:DNA-binding transcriptional LysR family regulator